MDNILEIQIKRTLSTIMTLIIIQYRLTSHNFYLDLRFASRFVAHLWSLCVHVHISFVLYLTTKHLGPGLEASLQTHSKDAFNLRKQHKISIH